MEVDFSKLPSDIRRKIPLSLRSYSNIHTLEELPLKIQYIIKNYFEKVSNVNYDVSFDVSPTISKYSDFKSFDNLTDLSSEYLKNYLLILPETYPFDPYFGSILRYQVQTRDVNLRKTLITAEINNIIESVSTDIDVDIDVESVEIIPTSTGASTEYSATIFLKINNDQKKRIDIDFVGSS